MVSSGFLFSVIIPVHNKKPHIHRSISSVLSQTVSDFELIVVDDASSDGSYKEIKKFNDERIRIYQRNTPGPGGYAARNLGIKKAVGEWVAFLDADDEWDPDFLNEIKNLIQKFPEAGMLCTAYKIVHPNGNSSYNAYYKRNKKKQKHSFDINDFLRGPRPPWTSVTAVKRNILQQIDGFDENWQHGADTELWLRVLLTGVKGAWSPKVGATYFKDSVNMVTDNRSQEKAPWSETVQKYLKDNSDVPFKAYLKRFSNRQYIKPFIRRANNKGFSLVDILQNFYLSYPSKTLILFLIASVLPSRLQQKLVNKLQK